MTGHLHQAHFFLPLRNFGEAGRNPGSLRHFCPKFPRCCDRGCSAKRHRDPLGQSNEQEGMRCHQHPKALAGQWPPKGLCVPLWGRRGSLGQFPHLLRTCSCRGAEPGLLCTNAPGSKTSAEWAEAVRGYYFHPRKAAEIEAEALSHTQITL